MAVSCVMYIHYCINATFSVYWCPGKMNVVMLQEAVMQRNTQVIQNAADISKEHKAMLKKKLTRPSS
jgi:hypothetical protein